MQAAEGNEDALRPVVIRQRIGAPRAGDVDLNRDEVRPISSVDALDMLVDDGGFVVGLKVGSERREAKRREQRVFDRSPVRAGGLRQGGEDELDAKRTVRGGHLRRQYDIANNFAIESIVWLRTGSIREMLSAFLIAVGPHPHGLSAALLSTHAGPHPRVLALRRSKTRSPRAGRRHYARSCSVTTARFQHDSI